MQLRKINRTEWFEFFFPFLVFLPFDKKLFMKIMKKNEDENCVLASCTSIFVLASSRLIYIRQWTSIEARRDEKRKRNFSKQFIWITIHSRLILIQHLIWWRVKFTESATFFSSFVIFFSFIIFSSEKETFLILIGDIKK